MYRGDAERNGMSGLTRKIEEFVVRWLYLLEIGIFIKRRDRTWSIDDDSRDPLALSEEKKEKLLNILPDY